MSHPFPARSDLHVYCHKNLWLEEANMGKLTAWQSQSAHTPQRRAHRAWFWRVEKLESTASLSFSWRECCLGSISIPLASQFGFWPKTPNDPALPTHADMYILARSRTSAGRGSKPTLMSPVLALPWSEIWLVKLLKSEGSVINKAVTKHGEVTWRTCLCTAPWPQGLA